MSPLPFFRVKLTPIPQVHAFHQATKRNGRWVYSPFRRRPVGPFHPANKPSLICVTRSGHIRLVYQNPDNKWAEVSAELKNTGYSDKLLTHAAIVATPGGHLPRLRTRKMFFYKLWLMSCSQYHYRYPLSMPQDLSLSCSHYLESCTVGSKPEQTGTSTPALPRPELSFRPLQG